MMNEINTIDESIAYDKHKRWRYKKITKDTIKFISIYNEFMANNPLAKNINSSVEDFIIALRTHLLMINYSSKKFNLYINDVVIPNIKIYIDNKIKNYNK